MMLVVCRFILFIRYVMAALNYLSVQQELLSIMASDVVGFR